MERPIIRIHNTQTNQIIDRAMNDEEFAVYQRDQEAAEKEQADLANKEVLRQSLLAKLAALGLTEDEIAAL